MSIIVVALLVIIAFAVAPDFMAGLVGIAIGLGGLMAILLGAAYVWTSLT